MQGVRLSRGAYFWTILIAGLLSSGLQTANLIGTAMGEIRRSERLILPLVALPVRILHAVVVLVLLYKAWRAIQGHGARTTPGKAAGFCLIPFYNFYWMFQATWGLAVDFNRAGAQRGGARISQGVPLWMCILALVGLVPLVGLLAGLAAWILQLVFVWQVCTAVSVFIPLPSRPPDERGSEPLAGAVPAPEDPPPVAPVESFPGAVEQVAPEAGAQPMAHGQPPAEVAERAGRAPPLDRLAPAPAPTPQQGVTKLRPGAWVVVAGVLAAVVAAAIAGFGAVLVDDGMTDPEGPRGTAPRYYDGKELGIGAAFIAGGAALAILGFWRLLPMRRLGKLFVPAIGALGFCAAVVGGWAVFGDRITRAHWFTSNVPVKIPTPYGLVDSNVRRRALVESLRGIGTHGAAQEVRVVLQPARVEWTTIQLQGRTRSCLMLTLPVTLENTGGSRQVLEVSSAIRPLHADLGPDGFRLLKEAPGPYRVELEPYERRELRVMFIAKPGTEGSAMRGGTLEVLVQGERRRVPVDAEEASSREPRAGEGDGGPRSGPQPPAPQVPREAPAAPPALLPAGDYDIHVVQPGDTLLSIAHRFYGDGELWTRIKEANYDLLRGDYKLRVGMRLRIPRQGRTQAQTTQPSRRSIPAEAYEGTLGELNTYKDQASGRLRLGVALKEHPGRRFEGPAEVGVRCGLLVPAAGGSETHGRYQIASKMPRRLRVVCAKGTLTILHIDILDGSGD